MKFDTNYFLNATVQISLAIVLLFTTAFFNRTWVQHSQESGILKIKILNQKDAVFKVLFF